MSRSKNFWKNGFLLTLVGIALRTVALGFSAYVSREVGAEGVGLYTLITTVYSFALTFATAGISLTVTRLVADSIGRAREEDIGSFIRGASIYSLLFSGAATVVLAILSGLIARTVIGDVRAILPLSILSLSLIPASLSGVMSGYFVGVRRVLPNALVGVLGQLFRVGVTVFLLATRRGEGVGAAVGALAIGVSATEIVVFAVSFIAFTVDRIIHRYRNRLGKGRVGEVAKMAFPLGISAYIRSMLLSLEHAVIPVMLEKHGESRSEALSSFGRMHGMALPLILYPMAPLSSFSGLLVPEFAESDARGDSERVRSVATRAMSMTLVYASFISVLLFIFSEELGYLVYSSFEAGVFIAVLSPVVPLMYLDHVTDSVLKGIGEHVYSMWVNIADSTLSLLLVILLVRPLGIIGYAVVIIGMELFNFILSYIRLRKRIAVKLDLVRNLALPLLASLLSAVLTRALFIPSGSIVDLPRLISMIIFSVSVFIGVYVLSLFLLDLILGGRKAGRS